MGTANEYCKMDKKPTRNIWFDDECKEMIQNEYEKRLKYLSMSKRNNKKEYQEAKKILKGKKRTALYNNVKDIENSRSNDTKKFFKKVESFKSSYCSRGSMVKNEEVRLLVLETDVQVRWKNYFLGLLSKTEEQTSLLEYDSHDSQGEAVPPDGEHIVDIVMKLRNNKSSGSDGISVEFMKAAGNALTKELQELIAQIWEEEQIPREWKESIIVPVYKEKGDFTECKNYREISLLNTAYKIFSITLYNRVLPYVERNLGDYQGGFRSNGSTIDQIFPLKQICKKIKEFNNTLWMLFVDFRTAYDTISRSELFRAMSNMKIPSKLVRLVMSTMENIVCSVKVNESTTEQFEISKGLRQGDSLALLLFNIVMQSVIKRAGLLMEGTIFSHSIGILAYADDLVLIGRSLSLIKEAFERMEVEAGKMGLR